jgi:hypothetical protein
VVNLELEARHLSPELFSPATKLHQPYNTIQQIRNQLKMNLSRESYIGGVDTTILNTVDIWLPESTIDTDDTAKLWVV